MRSATRAKVHRPPIVHFWRKFHPRPSLTKARLMRVQGEYGEGGSTADSALRFPLTERHVARGLALGATSRAH
jgi:hypothetical protein